MRNDFPARSIGRRVAHGAALLVFGFGVPAHVAVGPAGEWTGTYKSSESGGELIMHVDSAAGGWNVRVKVTSEYQPNPQFQDARAVRVGADSIAFRLIWGTPVEWRGRIRGDSATGVLSTDHWSGTWQAVRAKTESH